MRLVIRWVIVLVLVAMSASLSAQTLTRRLQWFQPNQTPPDLPTLVYTLTVDTAAPVTLTPTCALQIGSMLCSAPLAALTPGVHTLTLTVTSPSGAASGTLNVGPPSAPINIVIVVG